MIEQAFLHQALIGALVGAVVGGAAGLSRFFMVLAVVLPAAWILLTCGIGGGASLQQLAFGWKATVLSDPGFWLGALCGLVIGFGIGRHLAMTTVARPRNPWAGYE